MQFGQLFYSIGIPLEHPDDGRKSDQNIWLNIKL
jgi:hypothetical protein